MVRPPSKWPIQIRVSISKDMNDKLFRMSKDDQKSVSQLVRDAIEEKYGRVE